MEKRSILGFVLIGVVLMVWLYWNSGNQQKVAQDTKTRIDSLKAVEQLQNKTIDTATKNPVTLKRDSLAADSLIADSLKIKFGNIFAPKAIGGSVTVPEQTILVETEK